MLIVCTAWFIIHTSAVVIDGLSDNIRPADLCVVLGNQVMPDGQPSARLKSRLDKALELYGNGSIRYILVSGGIGREGFDEAEVMKRYLMARGVPEGIILTDNQGANTWRTALNTRRMMSAMNLQSALIVTQYYHVSRTKLAFARAGIRPAGSAHADIAELRDAYSLVREFFGFYEYFLLKRQPGN